MRYETILDLRTATEDEWLTERHKGITGSDCAALLGVDSRKSPTALYYEKVADRHVRIEDNMPMKMGRLLEPIVCGLIAEDTGLVVTDPKILVAHPDRPWQRASPDRFLDNGSEVGLGEAKTTGFYLRDEWEEGVPDRAAAQTAHYIETMDAPWAYVGVLIAGQDFRHYFVERDENVLAMIAEQEALFWQRILDRRPPPVDGAASTSDALKAMFPEAATGKLCELPSELIPVARELAAVRAERARLKELEAEHANRIRAALEDAETATVGGEPLLTFKSHLRSQFDKAALEAEHPELVARHTTRKPTRTLRFVTPKKEK